MSGANGGANGGAYVPQPGTVAFRALAHLETLDRGAELSTGLFAEALGVPPGSLQVCLTQALQAGLLFRRQKDRAHARSPFFWSLVRHDAAPPPMVPRPPVPATPPAVRVAAPSAPVVAAAAPAAPAAPVLRAAAVPSLQGGRSPLPRIALWNDFTLEVTRANGDTLRFSRQETAALWQYFGLFAEG